MLKYIPNILTVIRFLLIPIIIIFIIKNYSTLAIVLLTISGITDVLDGIIARKFNLITDFGKLIDPLADKATQICILGTLVVQNIIPFWILVVILIKEFCMVAGASFLYGKELVVSSRWYGKVTTALLYVAIVCSLGLRIINEKCSIRIYNFDQFIYYLALIATIFSLLMYMRAFLLNGYITKKEKMK